MTISVQKHISRRRVLRGCGAVIGLPLLDAMVPAHAAARQTAATPVRRFAAVYVPNGMNMWNWTPHAEGTAFEITPILASIAAYRERMLVLTGLANRQANAFPG